MNNQSTNSKVGEQHPSTRKLKPFRVNYMNPNALFEVHKTGSEVVMAKGEMDARSKFSKFYTNLRIVSVEPEKNGKEVSNV